MLAVTYTYTCDLCHAAQGEPYPVPHGGTIPQPVLPHGWTQIDGRAYCERHKIVVMDGEETDGQAT